MLERVHGRKGMEEAAPFSTSRFALMASLPVLLVVAGLTYGNWLWTLPAFVIIFVPLVTLTSIVQRQQTPALTVALVYSLSLLIPVALGFAAAYVWFNVKLPLSNEEAILFAVMSLFGFTALFLPIMTSFGKPTAAWLRELRSSVSEQENPAHA